MLLLFSILCLRLSGCVLANDHIDLAFNVRELSSESDSVYRVSGLDMKCVKPTIGDVTNDEQTLSETFLMGMTLSEKILFLRRIRKASYYFEYGCGGSTILACKSGNEKLKIVSLDSHKDWLAKVRNDTCFSSPENAQRLTLHQADIGPVAGFGYPVGSPEKWANYSGAINHYKPAEINLVMVDGRFRVACALQAMLSTKPGTEIMFHDFFIRRDYYPVLRFADVVDCADTFVVFKRKASVSDEDIMLMLRKYSKTTFRI